ncbi:hypothetical protein [Paraburkholderia sp. RL17-337-BIB-A]|uniref:hypothetical protein n=1 Tax=Paraburkholderia sp. RL17-337-BIB-A TaxID=3031636 RepID=UPI0038B82217
MIAGIPRNDQVGKDWAGVRLAPPSRSVTAASSGYGFVREGEEIEAAVDGICIANFPEETAVALRMSIRMAHAARLCETLLICGGRRYVQI